MSQCTPSVPLSIETISTSINNGHCVLQRAGCTGAFYSKLIVFLANEFLGARLGIVLRLWQDSTALYLPCVAYVYM